MIPMTLAVLATAALADPNPLAPARDGQVQCYEPDSARKTCHAIGAYRWAEDGAITNDATVALGDDPLIILHASAPVYVRDAAECAVNTPAANQITSIEVDGTPLTGAEFDEVRKQVGAAMDQTFAMGSEYCSTYHPREDGTLKAIVTIDGELRPDLTSNVLWVRLEDGWRVAP